MNLDLKGPGSNNFLPMEIQILLDKWLCSRTQAMDHSKAIREQLSTKNIVEAAKKVISRYNLRAIKTNKDIDATNNATWDKFLAKEITDDQATEMYLKRIPLAEGHPTATWAKRFKDRFGWRTKRLSAPGDALPLNHWKVVQWRRGWTEDLARANVDERLVLNYDQVWRIVHRGSQVKLYKARDRSGRQLDGLSRKQQFMAREARGSLAMLKKKAYDEANTYLDYECLGDSTDEEVEADPDFVSNIPVAGARLPHTCVTSVWASGHTGPLIYVFGSNGPLKASTVAELNNKYQGEIFCMMSGIATHFMDTDSTLRMWEGAFAPAFAQRRKDLGLTRAVRGALVYDSFSGNEGSGGNVQREKFLEDHNLIAKQILPHGTA
ncbi:unnamed protein product, partial [Prorocentrum cordatum]